MMEDKLENTPTTLKRKGLLGRRKGRGGNPQPLLLVIIFLVVGLVAGLLAGYLLWGRNLTPVNPNKENGLTEESSTGKEGQVVIPGAGNLVEVFGEDVVFFVRFPGTVNLTNPEATREAIRQFIEKEPSWFFPGLEKPKEYQQLMQNLLARLKLQEAGYAQDYLLSGELSEDSAQMSAFEELAKVAGEGSTEEVVPKPGGRSFTVSFRGDDKVRKFSLDLGFNKRTLELEVQQIAEIE
jgi:hypothetical protein